MYNQIKQTILKKYKIKITITFSNMFNNNLTTFNILEKRYIKKTENISLENIALEIDLNNNEMYFI